MKIVCAGFPKTGTKSMALALRELGYIVHDFEEHLQYHLDDYLDFFEGRVGAEIFKEMYQEIDAVVDQPACTLWNIIRSQFTDVKVNKEMYEKPSITLKIFRKVILMERKNSKIWVDSYLGMFKYFFSSVRSW